MSKCFGIKIILDDKNNTVVADADIGLYNVANENSEFRWIQNSIVGLTGWADGIIVQNGISKFSVNIDLRNGGNTSSPGNGDVTIKNNNKFQDILISKNINLQGLKLEIWYFNFDDGNSSSTKIRTYTCCSPSYTNKEYKIPFKGMQEKRRSNILNVITTLQYPHASNDTIGKVVPATFGKLIPFIDNNTEKISRSSLSKFIRTFDKIESKFYNDSFFTGSDYVDTVSFPITDISQSPGRNYQCEFRSTGGSSVTYPVDTYVKIVDGTGKNQIREVYSFQQANEFLRFVTVDFFETELVDTGDDRSWVQFYKIYRRYDCDHWPCKGFYDSNGNHLTNGAEIYTHTNEDGFSRIAPFGYEFNGVNEAYNQIEIDPKLFDQGDLDTQNSYMILPVENLHADTFADLSNWYDGAGPRWDLYLKHATYDGLYSNGGTGFPDVINDFSITDLDNIVDKVYSTYGQIYLSGQQNSGGCSYIEVLKFDLPKIPSSFTFSNFYIGIRMLTKSGAGAMEINTGYPCVFLKLRKFKYGIKEFTWDCDEVHGDGALLDDIPDFYYSIDPNNSNENFFKTVNASDNDQLITGINNTYFDTGITSKEEYESYLEGVLWFERAAVVISDPAVWTDNSKIYELCFIFKRESDIKENIYIPFHGRLLSQPTWREGFEPWALLETPQNLLEHVCRLQNYQDTCSIPVSGWGLQYASDPLIATNGYGSFDDPDLTSVRNYYAACQITEYEKGYTDEIKTKICKDFVLANWQDSDNKERVIPLPENKINPVCTITLDEIVDRNSLKINELPQELIYSEPFIRFDKNPSTNEFESIIQIKNTSASVYVSDYVVGIRNNTDKVDLWNSCHSLAIKCHQLNKPSSDLTDLQWANGQGSYTIALNYLKNWIKSQFYSEIEFQTHFNIAGSWGECTPFNVVFSQQTNNISRSCLVEECTINPNHPYDEMIRAIMYA